MEDKKKISISLNTLVLIIIIVLILIVLGVVFYIKHNSNANVAQISYTENPKETLNNVEKVFEINSQVLEKNIKSALIEKIAKDESQGIWAKENSVYAEGHKTLRSEVKNNQIYAYITAQVGTYTLENGNYENTSGMAGPIVLIFDINSNDSYTYSKYLMPEDGMGWLDSLKKIFPSDLIDQVSSVDYRIDFYQDQIKNYLK